MADASLAAAVTTTLALAGITTALLLLLATPLAWWLARSRNPWREVAGAVAALPLVLPPTVIGFYLLVALGPDSPLMAPLRPLGIRTLAFTFPGLVIGSIAYSLPFAVQPLRTAFEAVPDELLEAAAVLGAGPWARFARIAAPLSARGFLSAAILVFAHTVGEFGVVLMIGGAIPGRTEVLSTRIYALVEAMDYAPAHAIAAGLVGFGFASLLALAWVGRQGAGGRR